MTADAQASYDFGPAQLSVSIVNLFDEDGFEPYQYFGGTYVVPTQARSAFVTLRKNSSNMADIRAARSGGSTVTFKPRAFPMRGLAGIAAIAARCVRRNAARSHSSRRQHRR